MGHVGIHVGDLYNLRAGKEPVEILVVGSRVEILVVHVVGKIGPPLREPPVVVGARFLLPHGRHHVQGAETGRPGLLGRRTDEAMAVFDVRKGVKGLAVLLYHGIHALPHRVIRKLLAPEGVLPRDGNLGKRQGVRNQGKARIVPLPEPVPEDGKLFSHPSTRTETVDAGRVVPLGEKQEPVTRTSPRGFGTPHI